MANSLIAPRLKTPGVYIEEISQFPPSVAQVPTAIPVFVGHTAIIETGKGDPDDLLYKPTRISSMLEYEKTFGSGSPETGIQIDLVDQPNPIPGGNPIPTFIKASNNARSPYRMYYALQWFFANGGGDCWIVSVGNYTSAIAFGNANAGLIRGVNETDKIDEITLFVFPDAHFLDEDDYYNLYKAAIDKCVELQDRFTIVDVRMTGPDAMDNDIAVMRDKLTGTVDTLKYGAAYYPDLETILDFVYNDESVNLVGGSLDGQTLDVIKATHSALYARVKSAILSLPVVLSPSSGIAGIYASVDSTRGVWKAPANVGLDYVIRPTVAITDKSQEGLNVDVNSGKSVNAIRSFTGKGTGIVWGARTLAGNDNEWRYVPVRRFFNMVEESVKKATVQFVFEPNDKNTWVRVKGMIDNFLTLQWRAGALAGAAPEQAFYVKVGLNETMTALDILEGRMIVEIGMAVVRPAEFIILQFMHKMQES